MNARWEKAFSKEGQAWTKEDQDWRTTVIVDHLFQAFDIHLHKNAALADLLQVEQKALSRNVHCRQ
jgi:hypothetical protein